MASFRIGDLCIGVGFMVDIECNGMECTVLTSEYITASRCFTTGILIKPGPVYKVLWADGVQSVVSPCNLRLRRPPSWDRWIYDTSDVQVDSSLKGEVGA